MKRCYIAILLLMTLFLSACSARANSTQADSQPAIASTESFSSSLNSASRVDEQGAIVIEITPLNLDTKTDVLEFDVVMSTHSVDLSMDLAPLSTLSTDTGIALKATTWKAPRGGHHVQGTLIFPAVYEGKPILDGAGTLTLTIISVDAATRIFEWQLK